MPAAFTWWTWTVPETVLWQTLRVSPPLPARGGLFIEVGGGIRTEDRIREYLDLGVSRCILGTVAVKDFAFTARMAEKYGEKIAVGVDARDGYVAINGWKELSPEKGVDFCRPGLYAAGVGTIIYTDISRDGGRAGHEPLCLPGAGGHCRSAGDCLWRHQLFG